MKSLTFFFICIYTILNVANAQNCKGIKDKKDPFTNKIERKAEVTIGKASPFAGGIKWRIDLNQVDGITTMKWNIAMMGEFNQAFPQGTKLLLRLDNGTILTQESTERSSPVTQAINGGGVIHIFSTYTLSFTPDKEILESLSQSPITDIKVTVPDRHIESPKIVKKQMTDLMHAFNCFLQTQS